MRTGSMPANLGATWDATPHGAPVPLGGLHVWVVGEGERLGLLAIAAPARVGQSDPRAVFDSFAAFVSSDTALTGSAPLARMGPDDG